MVIGLLITIGEIISPRGNRGELKVLPTTDFPERFRDLQGVYLAHPGEGRAPRRVAVEGAWLHRGFVVLKVKGCDDPGTAESLRGYLVQVEEEELVKLPPGHFYVFQVIGLQVYSEEGELLGKVRDILRTGSNDVYVVERPGGDELLVPGTREVVKRLDPDGGRMVIHMLPGLVE